MSSSKRQIKTQRRLELLEAEFRDKLIASLKMAAQGEWGLFATGRDLVAQERFERWYGTANSELSELGDAIVELRGSLGMEAEFPLCDRFRQFCSLTGSNDVGEPKRAKQFLRELGLEEDA